MITIKIDKEKLDQYNLALDKAWDKLPSKFKILEGESRELNLKELPSEVASQTGVTSSFLPHRKTARSAANI